MSRVGQLFSVGHLNNSNAGWEKMLPCEMSLSRERDHLELAVSRPQNLVLAACAIDYCARRCTSWLRFSPSSGSLAARGMYECDCEIELAGRQWRRNLSDIRAYRYVKPRKSIWRIASEEPFHPVTGSRVGNVSNRSASNWVVEENFRVFLWNSLASALYFFTKDENRLLCEIVKSSENIIKKIELR